MEVPVSTGAILFTDMVDSTALRSRLGEERADQLRRHHDRMLADLIDEHHGEVARWTGDGVKAAFGTASEAIGAAVAIQRATTEYGLQPDAVAAFQIRIGISIGEVTIDESGDRRGVAAVEAARLEALARPGEILATEMVRMLGHRRANVAFEELGGKMLKGIDFPVVVFRVVDMKAPPSVPLPRFLVTDSRFPLVGRADIIDALRAQWEAARTGRPRLVFLRGQAGIGKTRLASQLASLAQADGALVLGGVCSSDVDVPYEPLAMAFRDAHGRDPALDTALEIASGPLARLFPGGAAGGKSQPNLPRYELFDAVSDLVRRLAKHQPLLLVIDDLHWATAPTVLLLRHLVAEWGDNRLLIAGTFREAELDPFHPLRDLLHDTRSAPDAVVVDPAALTESDVAQLIGAVAQPAAISRVALLAEAVRNETAGNPFFVAEMLRHLSDTGQLDRRLAGDADASALISVSVSDVVTERLAQLVPWALDLLRAASVIGASFDVDLLATVSGRRPDEVLDVLEGLIRAGLVSEVGVNRFSFVHAIVRTALLDELSTSRKARVHRAVAEALEADGADQFDELAHHWQMAGVETNATKYLMQAADRDMRALAFESAKARFGRVVELLNHDVRASAAARARAWLGYAAAIRALGDPTFKDAVVRAARLARSAHDVELMAGAASLSTWLGTMYFWTAEMPDTEMIELCEDVLALLPEASPKRVQLLATLASHLSFAPTRDRRVELIAEANRLANEIGDLRLIIDVLHAEHVCLWEPATIERREQIARDLSRLARATDDAQAEFLGGFFASYCLLERGEVDACIARLRQLDPVRESTPNEYYEFLTARLQVSIDILRGDAVAPHAVDALFHRFGPINLDAEGSWMIQTAVLAYQSGTLGELVGSLQEMTTGPQSRMWAAGLSVALSWSGDSAGAAEVLDRPDDLPHNYFWLPARQARGEAAASLGRLDHCRAVFDDIVDYRGRLAVTGAGSSCFGLVSRTLGVLALALGETAVAIELLNEAIIQADRIGARFDGVSARRSLAACLHVVGRSDEADVLLGEAAPVAESNGFLRETRLIGELRVMAL